MVDSSDVMFPNLAGHENPDEIVTAELDSAGIDHYAHSIFLKKRHEVQTCVIGFLDPSGWTFEREWYYWVAKGPGLPIIVSEALHRAHGKTVRVNGSCGCPPPSVAHGFAIGFYHVDTPRGLKALADAIKMVLSKGKVECPTVQCGSRLPVRCEWCGKPTTYKEMQS